MVARPDWVQGRGSGHLRSLRHPHSRLRPCDGRRLSLEGCKCAAEWRATSGHYLYSILLTFYNQGLLL